MDVAELNESWLHGIYENGEINTNLSYVSIGDDFFAQGDAANNIIKEIHKIWLDKDIPAQQAFDTWISNNL